MELKWLEDFLSLAETHSFSHAASLRHVTQPALSRRIRALEAWLGAELIDRSTYPTRLTAAGEAFRDEAAEILRRMLDARALVRGERASNANTLLFAVPHTLALTFFPRWLARLVAELGPLATRLVAGNVHDAVLALVEGHCDLLMCYHHPRHPVELDPQRYPMLELGRETMLPYAAADDRGAPRYMLPGTRSRPVPFLAYTPNAYLGRVVETVLQAAPQPCYLDRRYQTDMSEALKAMVLERHGVAWLPESAVVSEVAEGELALAAPPQLAHTWRGEMGIRIYRDSAHPRPIVTSVWEHLAAGAGGGVERTAS